MLNYNEIKEKKIIIFEGEPYEVLSSHVFRKQQRKPVNQTKLKNLLTGRVTEHSFHQSDKAEEADMSITSLQYLYKKPGRGNQSDEYWFSEENNPRERLMLTESVVADMPKYVKENTPVEGLVFNEKIIGMRLPIKVDLMVTDAPPAIKGNTASGGDKLVTLETGLAVTVPLFINEGDLVRINTGTGEYTERVTKA